MKILIFFSNLDIVKNNLISMILVGLIFVKIVFFFLGEPFVKIVLDHLQKKKKQVLDRAR